VSVVGHHFDGRTALFPRLGLSRADGGAVTVSQDSTAMESLVLHRSEQPLSHFEASIECAMPPEVLCVGETIRLSVTLRNTSRQTWPISARFPVCVAYHWIDESGEIAIFEGLRTAIPRPVDPGETLWMGAAVAAPPSAGNFTLALTLVQEYVAWFDAEGALPLRLRMQVLGAAPPGQAGRTPGQAGRTSG
jgi:hypothetical protein